VVNLRNRADEEALETENSELEEIAGNSLAVVENELRQRRRERRNRRGESISKPKTTAKTEQQAANNRAATAPRPNIFQRIPVVRPIYNYIAESLEEMRKVTWPTREETYRLTRWVISFTVVSSIGLGIFDLFYGWWFRQALENETLFLGIGAGVAVALTAFAYYFFIKPDQISNF